MGSRDSQESCCGRPAEPSGLSVVANLFVGARPVPFASVTKVRLDTLLSQRGVFPSRTRAAASVLAGEVWLGAERRRLEKDLSAARADAAATERRLANPSFVEKAPEEVVARSRDRLAAAQEEIASLEERLAALPQSG